MGISSAIGGFIGVVLTLIAIVATDLNGDERGVAALLFPIPFLILRWTNSIILGATLALLQFPVYGAIVGTCWWRSWHVPLVILLLPTVHLLTWALAGS